MNNKSKEIQITPKQERVIEGVIVGSEDDNTNITYSHSTLCQTSLPVKNMKDKRIWKSKNGNAVVQVEAGSVYDPKKQDMVEVGLPFGTKPRLIINHINKKAIISQSSEIEIESSLRGFMNRIGCDTNGRGYTAIKDQLTRFSASSMTIGRTEIDGSSSTTYGRIVDKQITFFDNETVKLSEDYFSSLMEHAVPLDEDALYVIKDSSLQMDLYSMFSERLHRIPHNKPQFIPWQTLYEQYGFGYKRIRAFRDEFIKHLKIVLTVYGKAKVEEVVGKNGERRGIRLHNSPSPVPSKYIGFSSKKVRAITGADA
jgi:hypothetical protein